MESQALILSVSETMATSMKSVGQYVHKRLATLENKKAYQLAMQECLDHVQCGYTSLDLIKTKIKGVYDDVEHLYPKQIFNKREGERRSHEMAVDHALEIVSSLEKRFIIGGADDAPRNYNGKGVVYENQSIFR